MDNILDVAEVALDHCRNRYMEVRERMVRERKTPFDAHFLPADASRVRAFLKIAPRLQILLF